MGCVCGKEAGYEGEASLRGRGLSRKKSEIGGRKMNAVAVKREESVPLENLGNGDVRTGFIDKKVHLSRRVRDDDSHEKERGNDEVVGNIREIGVVPGAVEAEQVAAGWPSWLVAVAGEAIRGWIPRKADSFEKLQKIGQGTYSSVYMGRDLLNKKIVALKKVRFDSMDPESVKFMAREIVILRRLDHPNVIKLEALVTSRSSSSLYLVFEYMEHDLTGLAALPGAKFTEPQVKCYMQQLLKGLEYCHNNGVLHRDIKGSNLLIDNNGMLKIADFGLASYFDSRQRIPLTSRVVTLWYRPPELLLGATHYGVAVDLWSAGCILGELYTGKPIMPGRTEVEQLHKIFKLCGSPSEDYWRKSKLPHSTVFKPVQPYRKRIAETFKDLPGVAVKLMEMLLAVDPSDRGTADKALKSEYFRMEPLACEPSSLPKYPPSKEMNAKLREEEARRQGVTGSKGQKVENDSKRSKELRAVPAPDANAELATSMQRRQANSNPKSRSEYFNPQKEEAASGFPIDPPRSTTEGLRETSKDQQKSHPKRASYSGPLRQGAGSGRKRDELTRNGLSTLSNLVASRTSSSLKTGDKLVSSAIDPVLGSFGNPMRKHEDIHLTQIFSGSQQLDHESADAKEPVMDRRVQKEKKMNFSGPILVPSSNMEDVLKDHDRQIQDATRRRRHERSRGERVRVRERLLPSNTVYAASQNSGSN